MDPNRTPEGFDRRPRQRTYTLTEQEFADMTENIFNESQRTMGDDTEAERAIAAQLGNAGDRTGHLTGAWSDQPRSMAPPDPAPPARGIYDHPPGTMFDFGRRSDDEDDDDDDESSTPMVPPSLNPDRSSHIGSRSGQSSGHLRENSRNNSTFNVPGSGGHSRSLSIQSTTPMVRNSNTVTVTSQQRLASSDPPNPSVPSPAHILSQNLLPSLNSFVTTSAPSTTPISYTAAPTQAQAPPPPLAPGATAQRPFPAGSTLRELTNNEWFAIQPVGPRNDRRFECIAPGCNRDFKKKDKMQRHFNDVHLGLKNFRCPTCMQPFARKGNLDTHKRTYGH